jgi:uncharacterized membrane protein YvlD (DUF360 family)
MSARRQRLLLFLPRLATLWTVDAVALWITALVVPGVRLQEADGVPAWIWAAVATLLLGAIHFLLRPLVLLLARPLGFLWLFGLGLWLNGPMLWLTAMVLPGLVITGLPPAIVATLVFAAVNVVLTNLLEIDEEGSIYQSRIERQAARQRLYWLREPGIGLVILEIDGLSYHHLQRALATGKMPTLARLIAEEGYQLSRFDCGLPSQTSASQAGILFGDNFDIPAFRWYDKRRQKLYISRSDAAELNARYARGQGLLRGGSSIDNMFNGDAAKSLLTLADLRTADGEQKRRRAEDIYLLLLNPYFVTRTVALGLAYIMRELWEAFSQWRRRVYPRINRLARWYPFARAATSVLVRDLATNLAILDIVRGVPAIYVTWPGYDEVAHHAGPWSRDAFAELRRHDRCLARIYHAILHKAPRPYHLIILSDHGQSWGPTFKMRYGLSLREWIERHLPPGVVVTETAGGDTGVTALAAVQAELENVEAEGMTGNVGQAVAYRGRHLLDRSIAGQETPWEPRPAQVIVCASGNLAHVYFDLHRGKVTLSELERVYPGLVAALVAHEGIGLVCGYDDDGLPIALGKRGRHHLVTGVVEGEDPLLPYAPSYGPGAATVATRAWQLARVLSFPGSGDLMLISTVYPDGTVAAFEELIGSHGGLGGEQTDAFILHPPYVQIPSTRSAVDLFPILKQLRAGESVALWPTEAQLTPVMATSGLGGSHDAEGR